MSCRVPYDPVILKPNRNARIVGRRAYRVRRMSVCETNALFRNAIQVRRLKYGLRVVAGNVAPAEVVRQDDHDIGPVAIREKRVGAENEE